jgi:hypothetical protein
MKKYEPLKKYESPSEFMFETFRGLEKENKLVESDKPEGLPEFISNTDIQRNKPQRTVELLFTF